LTKQIEIAVESYLSVDLHAVAVLRKGTWGRRMLESVPQMQEATVSFDVEFTAKS
jgi:hypothetical protein